MAKRAQIDIVAKDKASGTIQKVSTSATALAASTGAIAAAALAAALAMKKLASVAIEARKAFEEQRRAVAGMEAAMKSMGRYTGAASAQIQQLAKALQKTTNFGDEATLAATKFLFTYREITDDLMPESIKVMQDLAALMGGGPGGLVRAANMLGKASMGMTGELRRVGISVDQATFKLGGYAAVLAQIREQVAGQAEAMADPWTQLGNTIGDTGEILGTFIAIGFDDWARDVNALISRVNESFDDLQSKVIETEMVYLRSNRRILQDAIDTQSILVDLGGIGVDYKIQVDNQELFAAEKKIVDIDKKLKKLGDKRITIGIDYEFETQALGLALGPGGEYSVEPPKEGETEEETKARQKKEKLMKAHYARMNQMQIRQLQIRAKTEKDATEKIMAEGDVAMAKLMVKQLKDDGMVFANADARNEFLLEKTKLFEAEKLLIMFEAKEKFNEAMKDWAENEVKILEETADADIETLRKRKAAMEEYAKTHGDAALGIRAGLIEWREEAGKTFSQYKQLAKDAASMTSDRLGDAIYDVIQGTKDWKDAMKEVARSIMEDISKMIIKMLVLRAIQASMGHMGFAGSLFASKAHEGGVVGSTSFPQRRVPAGAFAGAPRLHSGLAGDEFPAILQKGETVIPKGAKLSTGDFNISTHVTLEGGGGLAGSDATDEDRTRASQQIAGLVNAAIDERLRGHMRPGGMLNRSPA
jgi:lambda family phage tail tape measure protein